MFFTPLLDQPLSQLRNYQGVNPRPTDFDSYWDESLQELNTLDLQIELIPNNTLPLQNAECFDLWFTGTGGARIHAHYIRPKKIESPAPAILAFHGDTKVSCFLRKPLDEFEKSLEVGP